MTLEESLQALTQALNANTQALLASQSGGGGGTPAYSPPAAPSAVATGAPAGGIPGGAPSTEAAIRQMTPERAMQHMGEVFQRLSSKYQHDAAAAPILGGRVLEISRAFGVERISAIPPQYHVQAAVAMERLSVADANGGLQALQQVDLGLQSGAGAPAAGVATGNPM